MSSCVPFYNGGHPTTGIVRLRTTARAETNAQFLLDISAISQVSNSIDDAFMACTVCLTMSLRQLKTHPGANVMNLSCGVALCVNVE